MRWIICLIVFGVAGMAAADDGQVCFDRNDDAGIAACRAHAGSLAGSVDALQYLGQRLENAGQPTRAYEVYAAAVAAHPNERVFLQGLVRARRASRAVALIAGNTPVDAQDGAQPVGQPIVQQVETCRSERWQAALDPCEAALRVRPDDASLHERYADVLRSLGRPQDALVAYQRSITLDPENSTAVRKRLALIDIAGKAPASSETATTSASAAIVARLELLQDLYARGLIEQAEYADRRSEVLGAAFGQDKKFPAPPETAAAQSGRYHALIIGNDQYRDFVRLQTPQADARAVAAVLRGRYGFETRVLINANRYEILKALSDVRRQVREHDSLLIYYAGHGYLDPKTRRGYWLPVDAERDNFANWISTNDVTDTLAGVSARHAMVVADSCFSGSLLRDTALASLEPRAELLTRLASKRSRTVLTSGGLEPVLDDGDGKHSIFARVFLDALRENQGVLEAGRLFVTLRDRVTQNAEQTPQYAPLRNAGHEGGDFIFVRR